MTNHISRKLVVLFLICSVPITTLLIGAASAFADDPVPTTYLNVSITANPPAGSTVSPDSEIEYTLNYVNNGTATETNVQIWDKLPANVTFISASSGGFLSGPYVKWTSLGDLASNAGGSVTFKVKVNAGTPDGTTISNQAGIFADGTPKFHSDPITHVTPKVVLTIEKSSEPPSGSTVDEASTITYTLTYRNTGTKVAANVVITDALPANTSFLEASSSGTFNNNVVTWNLGDVAAGFSGTVTFKVKVNTGLADGTVITNQATIDSNETDPVNSNIVTHNLRKTTITTQGSPSTPVTTSGNTNKTTTGSKSSSPTPQSTDQDSTFPRTDTETSPWPLFIYLAVMATSLLFLVFKRKTSSKNIS